MPKKKMKTMAFEEPLIELRKKISELKEYTKTADVDLSSEITSLEERFAKLEEEIYENMKPWDRVQVARHPERPTTLDYLPLVFKDFIELHGDRVYGDDEAIIGGIGSLKGSR